MRVVADTSVWVSALLWTGLPHRILESLESYRGILISTPREFLAKKFQDRLQAE